MEKGTPSKNMKLCKACGKEIAKSATACPHCGAKNKKPIFVRPWFFVLVAIVAYLAWFNLSYDKKYGMAVTDNYGETAQITAQDLLELAESNSIQWNEQYNGANVVITGKIDTIHGKYVYNKYPCEAAVEIAGGWFIEFRTPEELAGFSAGDYVEITGHITDYTAGNICLLLRNDEYNTTIRNLNK